MAPVDLSYVINPADIGVGQLSRDSYFGKESLPSHGIFGQYGRKELQGYSLSQLEIIGTLYFAHAAASQQPDDAVAIGQNCSGSKTSRRDRVGRDYPGDMRRFCRLRSFRRRRLHRGHLRRRTQRLCTRKTEPAIRQVLRRAFRALDHRDSLGT